MDNWGFVVGCVSSVVCELVVLGLIDELCLIVLFKGESDFIVDNSIFEGCEENCWIEIEIDFVME